MAFWNKIKKDYTKSNRKAAYKKLFKACEDMEVRDNGDIVFYFKNSAIVQTNDDCTYHGFYGVEETHSHLHYC